MPVHEVKGQPGCYQWGESGKIYCGAGAKEKAERQGRAIYSTGWREAETFEAENMEWVAWQTPNLSNFGYRMSMFHLTIDGNKTLCGRQIGYDSYTFDNKPFGNVCKRCEKREMGAENFNAEGDKKSYSVEIARSSKPEKKLMAVFSDKEGNKIKTTHFGQRGASDYTKHGDKERMERYLERHGGGTTTSTKEDWKDPTTAGSLSRWILWNKPSLSGSFADYKRRFGLKGTMKVSKSAENIEELTHSSVIEGYQPFKYSVVTNAEENETAISLDEFRDGLYHLFMKDKITESDMIGWSNDYEAYLKGIKTTKPPFSAEFNALTPAQKSLNEWTDQNWRTKSGKPSTQGKDATGERYLPEKAIKALSDKDYKRTSAKKKRDTKAGKQFSNQPDDIEKKVKKYRSETFEAIEGKGSNARFTDMPDPKVYRDPKLRQKARNTLLKGNKGGNAGEWSARKAQISATKYRKLYEKKYGEGKNPYF